MLIHNNIFTKKIFFNETTKENIINEIEIHKIASKYDFVPNIIDTKFDSEKCTITMEYIAENNLADKYGENSQDIPEYIWDQIRDILTILLEEEGIEYIDVTPYNFIEKDNKVYIVDFGHAYYTDLLDISSYLDEFIYNELNEWNIDFK